MLLDRTKHQSTLHNLLLHLTLTLMAANAKQLQPPPDASMAIDSENSCPRARSVSGYPKVASSAPVRLHVLIKDEHGVIPRCDCGRKHAVYGETYRYCTCGLSKDQPWCDDRCLSESTVFRPCDFKVDKKQTYLLMCACKRTKDPRGTCDGEHIHIDWSKISW